MNKNILQAAILRLQSSVMETYEAIKDAYSAPSDEKTVDTIAQLAMRLANLEGALITLQQYASKIHSEAQADALEGAIIAARQVQEEIDAGTTPVKENRVVTIQITNSYGKTLIVEKIKSRDHTERMLKHNVQTIRVKKGKQNLIEIKGKESLSPINISIPGDPSSASFYAALCLLSKNSKVILKQVHINPTRIGFFNII